MLTFHRIYSDVPFLTFVLMMSKLFQLKYMPYNTNSRLPIISETIAMNCLKMTFNPKDFEKVLLLLK